MSPGDWLESAVSPGDWLESALSPGDFTDGSKADEKVAAAAVSPVAPNGPFSCRLRHHCSIYTTELQAKLFALKQESKFMFFSDSLSSLRAPGKLKTYHPLLIQIQDMLHTIEADQLTNDVHQCLIQLLIKNINYMQT